MALFDKVKAFATPLVEHWSQNQPADYDADTVQQQYLFSMASGALRSAHSFAILEQANALHDLPVVARILLERSVRADYAHQSSTNAVALLISECTERIDKLEKFRDLPDSNTAGLQAKIDSIKADVTEFEKLIPPDYPRGLKFYRICELCDLKEVYRSAYHLLSQPVHGSFHSGFQDVTVDEVMRFLMLMAPVETSNFIHWVVEGGVADGYWDLRKEISSAAFPKKNN